MHGASSLRKKFLMSKTQMPLASQLTVQGLPSITSSTPCTSAGKFVIDVVFMFLLVDGKVQRFLF